jgi:hypothetical protein
VKPHLRSRHARSRLAVFGGVAAVAVAALLVASGTIVTPGGTRVHLSAAAVPGRVTQGTMDRACSGSGLLFCEDFNELPAGAAVSPHWTDDTQQGTLTVEPIYPGSRTLVLHAHTVGNGRALLSINNFSAPGNSFYGRMWVKVNAFPVAPSFAHFILVQATGTGSTEMVRPVGGQYVQAQFLKNGGPSRSLWGIGSDGGATGDWTNWKESATAVPDWWQCIQWSMLAAGNRVQMTVDGIANPDLVVSTNSHGGNQVPFTLPTVNKIEIGWWLFQAGPQPLSFDAYFDNIALSSAPLSCGAPPGAA